MMKIQQFEDKHLAQYGYAILSDCEQKVVLIDPARNPEPYYQYAKEHGADIIGVILTHPHADFVSSHLELHRRSGVPVYASKLINATFPVTPFDEGQVLEFGKIRLKALNTPGHSPDSITIVLEHNGKDKAVFTGDTLFIGDCGRPDLRESRGGQEALRETLARNMYHSLRDKLMQLNDDVILYPGHGAGTLCGKALSEANTSTIGAEKITNWSLQEMTEDEFAGGLIADQPFIPAYFPFNVDLNKQGAPAFSESISNVRFGPPVNDKSSADHLEKGIIVVDTRGEKDFKEGHLRHSVNIMDGNKFETWLGSIIRPNEPFYLAGSSEAQLRKLVERAASIGYEPQIREAFVLTYAEKATALLDLEAFRANPDAYTIVDVRNPSEVKQNKIFGNSIAIPLAEIRQRLREIPTDKPIAVHCAGGYRSAAASSLIASALDGSASVFDVSESIKQFT